jgi:hypothetical protein
MSDEEIVDDDNPHADIKKHWNTCYLCGASKFDGTFCRNCLTFTGHRPLLIAADSVHCPASEEKEWTLCGIWVGREDHPVYKLQALAKKEHEIDCGECLRRVDQIKAHGRSVRDRPL